MKVSNFLRGGKLVGWIYTPKHTFGSTVSNQEEPKIVDLKEVLKEIQTNDKEDNSASIEKLFYIVDLILSKLAVGSDDCLKDDKEIIEATEILINALKIPNKAIVSNAVRGLSGIGVKLKGQTFKIADLICDIPGERLDTMALLARRSFLCSAVEKMTHPGQICRSASLSEPRPERAGNL